MTDLYKILGIDKSATPEEIKAAYRKQSGKYHPDRNKDPDADERMAEVNQAYGVLGDPVKRAQYDTTGDYTKTQPIGPAAIQLIIQIYMQGLEQKAFDGSYDYDKMVKMTIERNRHSVLTEKKKLVKKIPNIEKVLKRSHGEQLRNSIAGKLKEANSQKAQVEMQLQVADSALEQLRNFSIEQIHQINQFADADNDVERKLARARMEALQRKYQSGPSDEWLRDSVFGWRGSHGPQD